MASSSDDDFVTLDPGKRADELAAAYVSTAAAFSTFIDSLTAFSSPKEFLIKGDHGCVASAAAIRESLECQSYDAVVDGKCLLALDASRRLIKNYASVNFSHLCSVLSVVSSVTDYVKDASLSRPRNFMMHASPGAGKSHLVDCIAKSVGHSDVEVVSFNMATMDSKRDLVGVLNECRNIIVDRKMPLVFLDEFDADKKNYALLLPLLWDGKLDFENHPLKVGRCVFILAGSSKEIPDKLNEARECRMSDSPAPVKDANEALLPTETNEPQLPPDATVQEMSNGNERTQEKKTDVAHEEGKILDLFSRISGSVIEIPAFQMEDAIQPDKVVVAIALLRRRFQQCERVPIGLLKFISRATFRHSSRSIATLINEIPTLSKVTGMSSDSPGTQKAITMDQVRRVNLGDEDGVRASPLAFHLQHSDGVSGICRLWEECLETKHMQQISSEHLKLESYDAATLHTAVIKITGELNRIASGGSPLNT